jgi:uncharacterized membrane protein YphA (DoxX/SURF4 family)
MVNLIKIGKIFYGIGTIAYGIQQIVIRDFRPAIIPEFPSWMHNYAVFPYVTGVMLFVAGLLIAGLIKIERMNVRSVCICLGSCFLALIILCHFPYRFVISPYKAKHLGVWTDALKELAFSGGAWVVAGSIGKSIFPNQPISFLKSFADKLLPWGRIFFSVTMISFGIDHFYYTKTVADLVPSWFGIPVFWTYLGGVALIGSGIAIVLKIYIKPVSLLLAAMLFCWFVFLHIPRAIADPFINNGNEIVSAFDALVFCGISLMIANTNNDKSRIQ